MKSPWPWIGSNPFRKHTLVDPQGMKASGTSRDLLHGFFFLEAASSVVGLEPGFVWLQPGAVGTGEL